MPETNKISAVEKIAARLAEPEQRYFVRPPVGRGKKTPVDPGVRLERDFPDPEGLLDTAFAEIGLTLKGRGVPVKEDAVYRIESLRDPALAREEYELLITDSGCRISASDAGGMRRALYDLADRFHYAEGARPAPCHVKKRLFVRNRISRSYYGPTHRTRGSADELLDNVDYYPEAYLNRLAREGVNILWLSVFFSEVTWSGVMPPDADCPKRLEKLRAVVAKCRRYGIRVFVFCIEPRGFRGTSGILNAHPELCGVDWGWDMHGFCPSSETARRHLYEQTFNLFKSVPGLGGIIDITYGEALSSCFHMPPPGASCPRCAKLPPEEILRRVLEPMFKGMRDAEPSAEFISWFYRSHNGETEPEWIYDCAASAPEGVIMLYNFESGVRARQQGMELRGGDYWQSKAGPSERFRIMAKRLKKAGVRAGAKLQVSNAHELATVPVAPVPGIFFRKYRFLRKMGIDTVMYSWYFGCFPGLMNQAVLKLSSNDCPRDEETFLHEFASERWGVHAKEAAEAWKSFSRGFGLYPLCTSVQYHGPFHHGIAWALEPEVRLSDLQPTWRDTPASGDAIGKCLGPFTLAQMERQSGAMSRAYDKGLLWLLPLRRHFKHDLERLAEIDAAESVGILLRSGWNIFKFYLLRRKLYMEKSLSALDGMSKIVRVEKDNAARMIKLCENDLLTGWHSEACVYKFTPEILRERIERLEHVFKVEIPKIRLNLKRGIAPSRPPVKKENIYRADGSPVRLKTFVWSIKRRENGELFLRFKCSYPPGTPNKMSDKIFIHINDEFYSEYPKIIEFDYDGVSRSCYCHTPEECGVSANGESWEGSCALPVPLFANAENGVPFNIFRFYECRGENITDSWMDDPGEPSMGSSFKILKATALGRVTY